MVGAGNGLKSNGETVEFNMNAAAEKKQQLA